MKTTLKIGLAATIVLALGGVVFLTSARAHDDSSRFVSNGPQRFFSGGFSRNFFGDDGRNGRFGFNNDQFRFDDRFGFQQRFNSGVFIDDRFFNFGLNDRRFDRRNDDFFFRDDHFFRDDRFFDDRRFERNDNFLFFRPAPSFQSAFFNRF